LQTHKTPYFGGSRSFKVIDFEITEKLVTSACYHKQRVCAALSATVFTLDKPISEKELLGGTPLSRSRLRGSPSTRGTKFCHKKLEFLEQQQWRFRDPSLHLFGTAAKCDGRTDGRLGHIAKTHEAFCCMA